MRLLIFATAFLETPSPSAICCNDHPSRWSDWTIPALNAAMRSTSALARPIASVASRSRLNGSGTDGTANFGVLEAVAAESLSVALGASLPLGLAGIAASAEVGGVGGVLAGGAVALHGETVHHRCPDVNPRCTK